MIIGAQQSVFLGKISQIFLFSALLWGIVANATTVLASGSVKRFTIEGSADKSNAAVERFDSKFAREAAERRAAEYADNERAGLRSGTFQILPKQPEYERGRTIWRASCEEGGWSSVSVDDDHPNVYIWSGGGYLGAKGGADVGIGVHQALRKGCRGGH